MLTLLLLRHAKAEAGGAQVDYSRILARRGEEEAAALGAYMARVEYIPDLALVSAAKRTEQTFKIVSAKLDREVTVRSERALYNATGVELIEASMRVESARTLLIVAHNPGILDAALSLAQDGDLSDLQRLRSRFPPCALAVLSFNTDDWQDVKSGGRLETVVFPDDLESYR